MERLTNTKKDYELLIVPKEDEGFYWWEILSNNGLAVLHSRLTKNKYARDKTMRKYAALMPCAKLQGGIDNAKNLSSCLRPVTQHWADECRDYIQFSKWHRDSESLSAGDSGILPKRTVRGKRKSPGSAGKDPCHAQGVAGQDKAKRADAGVSCDHGETARKFADEIIQFCEKRRLAENKKKIIGFVLG